MQRIIAHWTGGVHKANATDRKHYHVIVEGDGTLVRGNASIKLNEPPRKAGRASHTLNCNSASIGISMACMARAKETPFVAGSHPMTREQWEAMIQGIASLCLRYAIPVTPQTVLSHAEVQGTLKIRQRNKWDFTRLAFDRTIKGATAIGDKMRAEVAKAIHVAGLPKEIETADQIVWQAGRVAVPLDDPLSLRATPGADGVLLAQLKDGSEILHGGVTRKVGPGIWLYVSTKSSPRKDGWVHSRHVTF